MIAHELGHILSDHMVYITTLNILLSVGGDLPFFLGIPFRAVTAVLLEWYRAAELSCDRAAGARGPRSTDRLPLADGHRRWRARSDLNLDAFMAQAMEYENWDDPSDRVRRFFNEIGQTHPDAVRRVSEIMKWVQSGEYDRIIRGEYRTGADANASVREEASDAIEFYAERFRTHLPRGRRQRREARLSGGRHGRAAADWLRQRNSGDCRERH